MTPHDQRALSFVLLLGAISVTWAWWAGRPYWGVLSIAALAWAAWVAWSGRQMNAMPALLSSLPLAAVPILGTLAGPPSLAFLEALLSPVLLYALSLGAVSATVAVTEECGPGALSFLTFLATVSAGTVALLSLYYADALLFTSLLPTNSDLMWPLSSLFVGAIFISLGIKAAGLEGIMTGQEEAYW